MDSPIDSARSPPPFAKQVVADAVKRHRDLAKQLHAKNLVLLKLEQSAPKSLKQKMSLSVPSTVRELHPQEAQNLERSFDAILAQREEDLRVVVQRNVAVHVATLEQLLADVPTAAASKLRDYFMRVHIGLVPDDEHEFHDYIESPETPASSPAVEDCRLALKFLHDRLSLEAYAVLLQQTERELREEERQEARTEATSMEFDAPTNELVAQLVQRSIAKETAKLNKEINSLRAQLNSQATPKAVTGGKKKARQTKPSPRPADGGRAAGQPRDGRRRRSEPGTAPKKRVPPRTRKN